MKLKPNRESPRFLSTLRWRRGACWWFSIFGLAITFGSTSAATSPAEGDAVQSSQGEFRFRPTSFPVLTEESETLSTELDRHQVQVRMSLKGAWGDSRSHQERLSWRVEQSLAKTQIGVWIPYAEPTDQASGLGDVEVFARRILSRENWTGFRQILWIRSITPSGDAKRSRGWESWGARIGLAPDWSIGNFEIQIQGELTRIFAGRSSEGHEADFQIAKYGARGAYQLRPAWTIQLESLFFDDVRVLGTQSVERAQMQSYSVLGIWDVAEFAGLGLGRLALGLQQNRRSTLSPEWAVLIGVRISPSRSLRTTDAGNSLRSL